MPKKISEMVENQIEQWITSGRFQPGDKLPSVRELCDLFNVGRSAVRDAMTALKGRGLLDVRQGEGAYVCQLDYSALFQELILTKEKDIHELYLVRKILEAGIVETAARLREPKHILQLEQILVDMKSPNMQEAWNADYQFHLTIAEATQNEILVQIMQTLSHTMKQVIMDVHRIILSCPAVTQRIYQQHQSIYVAIAAGAPHQAKQSMFHHLTYVEELLSKNP